MSSRDTDPKNAPEGTSTTQRIASEIDETRMAIGDDMKALGERLSPESLRDGARAVMHDAKTEAKDLLREVKAEAVESLREAKDGAVASLRNAKDSAMATVSETFDDVSVQARDAGRKTASFVSTNAVPLALIGMGVGWLTLSMRQTASLRAQRSTSRPTLRAPAARQRDESSLVTRTTEGVRDVAEHTRDRALALTDQARERATELTEQVGERGRELSHEVRDQARALSDRTLALSEESPLALGALVLAAGVGVALAIPSSPVEQRLVGHVGGELVDEVKRTARQVGSTATATAKSLGTSLTESMRAD